MIIYHLKIELSQGQIQDFPERGMPIAKPQRVVPTYYLAKFSRKLHENEEIWTEMRVCIKNLAMYISATAHYI